MTPSQILTQRQRDEFIERLGEFRREEREMAAHALQTQGYEPVSFLIAELRAAPSIAQWKFSAGRAVRNIATYGGELAIFLLFEFVVGVLIFNIGGGNWWRDRCSSRRGEAPEYSEEMRHRKRIGRIIRALACCEEDLRVVGPLCERMNEADEDALWRAQMALKSLLPRLRPPDSDLLNPTQKMGLYQLLDSHDAQMCLAALQAVANVGDSRALPRTQALAHSANLEIRQAALAALPALQERARREVESQTLLRGASAPVMSGDILLRPAPPVHAVNPDEMLRAASADNFAASLNLNAPQNSARSDKPQREALQSSTSKTQSQETNPHA